MKRKLKTSQNTKKPHKSLKILIRRQNIFKYRYVIGYHIDMVWITQTVEVELVKNSTKNRVKQNRG